MINHGNVPAGAADGPDKGLISTIGLGKTYGGGRGVAEVPLRLCRSEVLGFVGPHGAGKTTPLRMLAGLLRPNSGAGTVMGQDIGKMRRGSDKVGYMPQKLALYGDLTVMDNLRFRADMYCLKNPALHVQAALATFGLEDCKQQRAQDLSGGWARRLQLAAALIHSPAVILLDEPTAGLDAPSREDVWRRILALARGGAGVIVNTHDLLEAERCSRVALFRAGRIVRQGAPAELCESAPLRAVFVQSADAAELCGMFGGDPSVLSIEPHGRRWRWLVTADGIDAVRARLEGHGATLSADETRLADLALLTERSAATIVSAA